MQKNIFEKIKKIPRFWWILAVILIVGIFLRTYQHHDWLRFNADQGRDAELVSRVVNGAAAWPLLGPKAGGTQFRLGPAFYYFEIVSAKIFGSAPDKIAFPDLLTGILCIPLLFFFLRKYFEKYTAISMTAIFAVSNYAIRYARFAWNPNSMPFWTILALYAIHEAVSEKQKRKFLWSVVAGIAIGVGVQLHTTLMLIMPLFVIVVFGYLAVKNKKVLKYFFVVLAVALLANVPQLINLYQTKGRNYHLFMQAIHTKQQKESSLADNTLHSASCWVQGNLDIISGYEISDTCSLEVGKYMDNLAVFLLAIVFVLGGTILGYHYLRNEKDPDRKAFLGIISVFVVISFLLFLKLAFELSMRFYLILIFLPFLMLGFWIKYLKEKYPARYNSILIVAVLPLVLSNLIFVQKYFAVLASYAHEGGGDVKVTILSEVEQFSQFIGANSSGAKDTYIDGNKLFLFKSYKPLRSLVAISNINLRLVKKNTSQITGRYFYVATLNEKDKMLNDPSIKVIKYKNFGKYSMLLLQKI